MLGRTRRQSFGSSSAFQTNVAMRRTSTAAKTVLCFPAASLRRRPIPDLRARIDDHTIVARERAFCHCFERENWPQRACVGSRSCGERFVERHRVGCEVKPFRLSGRAHPSRPSRAWRFGSCLCRRSLGGAVADPVPVPGTYKFRPARNPGVLGACERLASLVAPTLQLIRRGAILSLAGARRNSESPRGREAGSCQAGPNAVSGIALKGTDCSAPDGVYRRATACPPLQLGEHRLVHVQSLTVGLLPSSLFPPQLVKRHGYAKPRPGVYACDAPGRLVRCEPLRHRRLAHPMRSTHECSIPVSGRCHFKCAGGLAMAGSPSNRSSVADALVAAACRWVRISGNWTWRAWNRFRRANA